MHSSSGNELNQIKEVHMHVLFDTIKYTYCCVAVRPEAAMPPNLARGKPTTQSSTYQTYHSDKAVDGRKANALRENSCAHTGTQKGPWWQVDLKAVYVIRQVFIKSRGDCCGQFIYGVVNLLCFFSSTYDAVSS